MAVDKGFRIEFFCGDGEQEAQESRDDSGKRESMSSWGLGEKAYIDTLRISVFQAYRFKIRYDTGCIVLEKCSEVRLLKRILERRIM